MEAHDVLASPEKRQLYVSQLKRSRGAQGDTRQEVTRILTAIYTSHFTTSDEMIQIAAHHSKWNPDSEVHVFHGTPKHGRVVYKVK